MLVMQAWILDESPGTSRWGEIGRPVVGEHEVAVEVRASGLNHMDHWLTQGRPRPPLPHIPGCDVAGVVAEVGSGVTGWTEGDEVVVNPALSSPESIETLGIDSCIDRSLQILGEHCWGGHAEQVVVPARNLVRRPAGRSWVECAAYPVATLTAHRMLRRARLEAGQTVLIIGIGGGVATATMALARKAGAEVFVTSRDPDKRAQALSGGADGAFDSSEPEWDVVADVVIDSVGPATWDQAIASLRRGGRLVTCGGTSGPEVTVSLPKLFFRQLELIGSSMGSYVEFDQVTELMADGLEVMVDQAMGLDEYPDALERLRSGAQLGTIVLDHEL